MTCREGVLWIVSLSSPAAVSPVTVTASGDWGRSGRSSPGSGQGDRAPQIEPRRGRRPGAAAGLATGPSSKAMGLSWHRVPQPQLRRVRMSW